MDLYSMIEAGGRMKFEVTAEDLVAFADRLIAKAQEAKALELAHQQEANNKETWITAKEVSKMCGVCSTTLWQWERKGYLVPAHVGSHKRYALTDVKKILTANKQAKPLE